MKALMKTAKGPGNMDILEVGEPSPGPGQVRVRVRWTGICGTDVHIASGEFFHYFPPLVLGHEFTGVVDEVAELTGGWGVEMAVEAVGGEAPLGACLDSVRKGGQILQVGLPGSAAKVNLDLLAWKEVRVVGTFGQKRSAWLTAIRLMEEEKVDRSRWFLVFPPLEEWRRGFAIMERGEGMKVLLEPAPL